MTLPPLAITRRTLQRRAPWWAAVVGGVALVVVGTLLVARPLAALAVLGWYLGLSCVLSGVAELSVRRGDGSSGRHTARATAAGWVVLGVVIVVWAGSSVAVLVPLTVLLFAGVVRRGVERSQQSEQYDTVGLLISQKEGDYYEISK